MHDCKPVLTPLNPGSRLSTSMSPQNPTEVSEMQVPYISVVGSLMYLAVTIRPDIAYAAGVLARFNSNPELSHWPTAKHVLQYLKGTMDYRITYQPSDSPEPFITYSDACRSCRQSGQWQVHWRLCGQNWVWSPSVLRMDNQSTIAVSKNPEHHGRMKHLSLCLFWIRNAVQDELIAPVFVPTQNMAADIFTKALDRFKVQKCVHMLGLSST